MPMFNQHSLAEKIKGKTTKANVFSQRNGGCRRNDVSNHLFVFLSVVQKPGMGFTRMIHYRNELNIF